MRIRRLLTSVPALVLVLAACGGSSGGLSDEEQEFADAWSLTLQDEEDGFSVPKADADCMSDAIMSELGTDLFDEADVAPGDIGGDDESNSPGELLGDGVISDAQADAIMDAWEEDCVDLSQVLADSASTEFSLDEEGVACFQDGLEADGLGRDLLRSSFTSGSDEPDEETVTALLTLIDTCGQANGEGGAIVDSIAESLAADGSLTEEQAQCVSQAVVDDLGIERLAELFAGGRGLEDVEPEAQQEITGALLDAAGACDVPVSAFGG